ncbi:hypothetical protein E1B28_013140 [Marasmius oreades]|uniref:Uncharacterized protein n=1 Tax=Marasmius oreades TaxID=181124 RepID=A0A9P7RPZ4_9AGAR|nr:uncharacterized protein E1B28_013140 [Marasmius oreades]KAG7087160.1 hypothetical protein E1B28_013140 [Marasmius oreades]
MQAPFSLSSMGGFDASATSSSQGSSPSSFYSTPRLDERGFTSETSPEGSHKDFTEPTLKDLDSVLDLSVFGISMAGGSSGTSVDETIVDPTRSDILGDHVDQKNLLDLTPFGIMNGRLKRQTVSAAAGNGLTTGDTLGGGGGVRPQARGQVSRPESAVPRITYTVAKSLRAVADEDN